jgi:hypothetical protein
MTTFLCPFVYASGKRCTGHITRVEAYKADLSWQREPVMRLQGQSSAFA